MLERHLLRNRGNNFVFYIYQNLISYNNTIYKQLENNKNQILKYKNWKEHPHGSRSNNLIKPNVHSILLQNWLLQFSNKIDCTLNYYFMLTSSLA